MIQSKPVQKGRLMQWIKSGKLVILGSLYVLFNILTSYMFLQSEIDFRKGDMQGAMESMSGIFIWYFGVPVSLVIYIIYAKSVKNNPKPAKYLLILPMIFWIVSLIICLIYQQSYLQKLSLYFLIHLLIGGISFLYFRLPEK